MQQSKRSKDGIQILQGLRRKQQDQLEQRKQITRSNLSKQGKRRRRARAPFSSMIDIGFMNYSFGCHLGGSGHVPYVARPVLLQDAAPRHMFEDLGGAVGEAEWC